MIAAAAAAFLFKAIVFPWLLTRTMRVVQIRREADPFIGYSTSLLIGIILLAVSAYFSSQWIISADTASERLLLVGACTMVLTGLLIVISRRKAISQILGYLILENGVFAFSLVTLRSTSILVELAILLDAFVAVFVMNVAIHQIQRGFEHIDVDQLRALKG